MAFILSSQNIFGYLADKNLCSTEDLNLSQPELKFAKNFNLLLSMRDGRKYLVKQERRNKKGETLGEFKNEWRVHEFLNLFPELDTIRSLFSEALYFNADDSVIIFNYLNDYCDLSEYHTKTNFFPTSIAASIGKVLSQVHRTTLNQQNYSDFFSQKNQDNSAQRLPISIRELERIGPEVFGMVPADGLKFFALYQRYDSLGLSIEELLNSVTPTCLTHNDIKLNNILLHDNWDRENIEAEQLNNSVIRLIDWERAGWGDPALDLGMLIAGYLQIWLSNLVISSSIDIQESLRLAMTPLDTLQPSIAALTKAYFANFPEILELRPDFLRRVVQFAGFSLIQQIHAMLQYQKSFGNTGICMLQVAKTLLGRPEQSISTVFGVAESELTHLNTTLA